MLFLLIFTAYLGGLDNRVIMAFVKMYLIFPSKLFSFKSRTFTFITFNFVFR